MAGLALIIVALLGCTQPEADSEPPPVDSGETGDTSVAVPSFVVVQSSCTVSEWLYQAETDGSVDRVDLDIHWQSASPGQSWDEHWELNNLDWGPHHPWDEWELEIDITTGWGIPEHLGTLFECSEERVAETAWRLRAELDEATIACVVWAGDDGDWEALMDEGCERIEVEAKIR